MALSSEEKKDWVEDLVSKNRELDSRCRALEEEVKTLKFKNEELTQKLVVQDNLSNGNVVNVGVHQENSPEEFQSAQDMALTINPLEVRVIAEVLMSYVDPKDLPNCRLVCKLWKKEVRVHLEKKMTFHIYGTRLGEIKTFLDYASRSFPMFQNLKLDVDRRSYKIFEPYGYDLTSGYGRTLRRLQLNFGLGDNENWRGHEFRFHFLDFLEDIRDLEIKMSCPFIHSQNFEFPHGIKKQFPILTTLRLSFIGTRSDSNVYPNPCPEHVQFFSEVLRLAPNLKTLYWGTEEPILNLDLIESILQVNPPKLERLHLYSKCSYLMRSKLINSGLKLKELYLDVHGTDNFGVHLVSGPNGKCTVTPRESVYSDLMRLRPRVTCHEMKIHLENALSQCADMTCTELLQVFMSAVDQKLQ